MLFILLCMVGTYAQTGGQKYSKQDALKKLYNSILPNMSWIPPIQDDQAAINVTVLVGKPSVLHLDNAKQTLLSSLTFTLMWNDSRMMWNPSQFSHHYLIEVDSSKVWTPSVMIQNSDDGTKILSSPFKVVVLYNGQHIWGILDVYKTTCKIDVLRFPFDTQVCNIVLNSVYGFNVNLLPVSLPSSLSIHKLHTEKGEWTLISTQLKTIDLGYNLTGVILVLTLKRKSTFYIMNIIFPMAVLSVLNSMVFLLPTSSGEKMGFIMTVFMAHAVFLNFIQNTLPTTSDQVSNLALYLLLNEIQGFLAIAGAIIVQKHYDNTLKDKEKTDSYICGTLLDCLKKWRKPVSQMHVNSDQGQDQSVSDEVSSSEKTSQSSGTERKTGLLRYKYQQITDRNLDSVFFVITLTMAFCNILILIL